MVVPEQPGWVTPRWRRPEIRCWRTGAGSPLRTSPLARHDPAGAGLDLRQGPPVGAAAAEIVCRSPRGHRGPPTARVLLRGVGGAHLCLAPANRATPVDGTPPNGLASAVAACPRCRRVVPVHPSRVPFTLRPFPRTPRMEGQPDGGRPRPAWAPQAHRGGWLRRRSGRRPRIPARQRPHRGHLRPGAAQGRGYAPCEAGIDPGARPPLGTGCAGARRARWGTGQSGRARILLPWALPDLRNTNRLRGPVRIRSSQQNASCRRHDHFFTAPDATTYCQRQEQ